jgi:hypothetical protein
MSGHDEEVLREVRACFEAAYEDVAGEQDPPAVEGAWGRFLDERLPGLLDEAEALPPGDWEKYVADGMLLWCHAERMREALRADGRWASTWRVGPDGKPREVWFKKGE